VKKEQPKKHQNQNGLYCIYQVSVMKLEKLRISLAIPIYEWHLEQKDTIQQNLRIKVKILVNSTMK
jgi:hypothetical protein